MFIVADLVSLRAVRQILNIFDLDRLDSSVGRASAFGAGGSGFDSRGRTIPKV